MAVPTKNPPSGSSSVVRPPARTKAEREGMPPDQFQAVSSRVVDAILSWRIPIAVGIVGVFAAAAGSSIYAGYQSRQNSRGAEEAAKAAALIADRNDPLGQLGIDLNDVARSPDEVQERNGELISAAGSLQKVATDFAGTTSALVAELERASFLVQAGKNDEAEVEYRSLLSRRELEPVFKFRALNGLGNLLRNQGKYPDAAAIFEQIVSDLDGVYKQFGLKELGRTYELAHEYPKATKALEEYLRQFPEAADAAEIGSRLALDKTDGNVAPTSASPSNTGGAPAASLPASEKASPAYPGGQVPADATNSEKGN